MWDVSRDEFESIEVGVLEVANLSLDEPELEAFLVQGEKISCEMKMLT